jgi:asparagine synthase (glutamine-hydrolysing)
MCGIAGGLSLRPDRSIRELVTTIVASQIKRGPDVQRCTSYREPSWEAVLGHDRLSIIDLRSESDQPMSDGEGELVVVFNGEIYNFVELRAELEACGLSFRTNGDTEVILAAYRQWGDAAFDRFLGMFAIGIYDRRSGELVLARDRFGVKPLFYWTDGAVFVFASTPTVIARWAQLPPDLDYVARGIRYKYYEDDAGASPYVGVMALEPSHLLRVRRCGEKLNLTKSRYYDVLERSRSLAEQLTTASDGALAEELMSLLRDATTIRRRSDVPLGLSVSGGLDSSAIAAILSERAGPIVGYSFAHPDDRESEGSMVAELARHTGIEPHWVQVREPRDIVDLFWQTLAAQDAPFPHVSIMAQFAVFRAARSNGTIVLLGGQGGDEAFMGYRKFMLFYAQAILRGRQIRALPRLFSALIPLIPAVVGRASVFASERRRYSGAEGGMGSRIRLPLPSAGAAMGMAREASLLDRQALDVTRYSLPTLLRYEDRNSMGNSVESRLPFLDQRVIEFGLALETRHKLGNGFGKLILRKALAGMIPDAIRLNRDKRGFDVNQANWIRSGLGVHLRAAIQERRATLVEFLPANVSLETLFSDASLVSDPQAFKEAVSLIWLGDRL